MKGFPLDVKLAYGPAPEMVKEDTKNKPWYDFNKVKGNKTSYSYIAEFPNDLDIPSFTVTAISLPCWTNGEGYGDTNVWFLDPIGLNLSEKFKSLFIDNKDYKEFNLLVKYLDTDGNVYERWSLDLCFKHINFGRSTYEDWGKREPNKIFVSFQTKNITIGK